MNWLIDVIRLILLRYMDKTPSNSPQKPATAPQPQQVAPTPSPNPDALLAWDSIPGAHHNVRALCDLCGLDWEQKESLTATVMVESGFNINAVRHNYIFLNGERTLASTDAGICQWNDHYHGKEITQDEAFHNPEMAVRLMCKYWRQGLMRQWVAYSSGAYLHWLGRV